MPRKINLKKKMEKENDKMWSLIVRKRDEFKCQMCGTQTKYVESAHVFGRSNFATRWDIRNGVALCFYCHRYRVHGGKMDDEERLKFWKEKIGEDTYLELKELSSRPFKRTKEMVEYWNKVLREQFKQFFGMEYEEYLKENTKKKKAKNETTSEKVDVIEDDAINWG